MKPPEDSKVGAIAKARSHPLRRDILLTMREVARPLSPIAYSRMVDKEVAHVSYHFSVLAKLGFIQLVKQKARRGAVEHFYVPSAAFTEELQDTVAMDRITEILEGAAEAGALEAGEVVGETLRILLATGRPVIEGGGQG